MKRLTEKHLVAVVLAFAILTGATLPATAEEPVQTAAKELFAVYAGSSENTLRLVSTHKDANNACMAARGERLQGRIVRVTNGKVIDIGKVEKTAQTWSVHRSPCKSYSMVATTYGNWEAEILAAAIRKDGNYAEIIYHMPQE